MEEPMSVVSTAPPRMYQLRPMAPWDRIYKLTTHQYHEMVGQGILTEGDAVELIEGHLIRKGTGCVYPLSVEQYREMTRTGILTEDDRVELLEGWLVCQMTKNPIHDSTIRWVRNALARVMPAGWEVDVQNVIALLGSEPEPDLAVIREDKGQYK